MAGALDAAWACPVVAWAVCRAVEWRAPDAAWVCRAEWRAPDAAWACPAVAWAVCRAVEWRAPDSAVLPWVGSVVIPVAAWEEPPWAGWADSAVHRWVEGSAADSAADSAAAGRGGGFGGGGGRGGGGGGHR